MEDYIYPIFTNILGGLQVLEVFPPNPPPPPGRIYARGKYIALSRRKFAIVNQGGVYSDRSDLCFYGRKLFPHAQQVNSFFGGTRVRGPCSVVYRYISLPKGFNMREIYPKRVSVRWDTQ